MCECFGRADVEIEELPPRYYGSRPVRRISLVRDIDRYNDDPYQQGYSRPRSSTASMRQIEYRPSMSNKQKEYNNMDKSQYKSPPKINYPTSSRFVPLPPVLHEDRMAEIAEPKKGILRSGKKKYNSQPSVVYSPKRGRGERKYRYEDEESDGDSWAGRSAITEWSEASGDSWAIRPVKKYADTRRKGRSRSRGARYN